MLRLYFNEILVLFFLNHGVCLLQFSDNFNEHGIEHARGKFGELYINEVGHAYNLKRVRGLIEQFVELAEHRHGFRIRVLVHESE